MVKYLLFGATLLGLPGVLPVAVPTTNIFNIATSMIVEGQDIVVNWNFDTGDGRHNFYLKRWVYNPSTKLIVFQEENYYSYSTSSGIVSGSFTIPASVTYLSRFELDIKAYGTRSGLHVSGGSFSNLIAKTVSPFPPYEDKLLSLNKEVDGNRVMYVNDQSYGVSFLLEGLGRSKKRRECGLSRFQFYYYYPENYLTAPSIVEGMLSIKNIAVGQIHIGRWRPRRLLPDRTYDPAKQLITIYATKVSDSGGRAKYTFAAREHYLVDQRTFHSREYEDGFEDTEFYTNDIYIPLGVGEGREGLSFEVEFGPFGEQGDTFLFKWSEQTFVSLADAGFSVVLGGE